MKGWFKISVVDPHHFDGDPDHTFPNPAGQFVADPDPACHFDAGPDPTFHFNADPDPNFQNDADP
jgi:hypothetical protein